MSDRPFGFNRPGGDDDDPDQPMNPFAAMGAGNFDVSQLGQMLTQLGQMLSSAGTAGPGAGPVNYDLAKQVALGQLSTSGLPSEGQARSVADAVRLAELWIDPVTTLPAGVSSSAAWAPRDWVDKTLPTWQRLCDPVARQMSGAWLQAIPEEARQAAGPLLAMFEQMGGMAFGSQLGAAMAQLGGEVLTSTDIGLPLGPAGVAALLPANIDKFATETELKASEVTVFLAAREAAHHRLFQHVPWLGERLLESVEEFAKGIRVDASALQEMAEEIDPTNPQSIERVLQSGLLEPKTTPEQRVALTKLETLLALVEGWVDVVVADAVGDRLPAAEALRETLQRRRASGGPAEQTFATLVGLELRPRRLRGASELWRRLGESRGLEGREAIWEQPDLIPTAEDLDDPEAFERRSADLEDPIAALDRAAGRKRDQDDTSD